MLLKQARRIYRLLNCRVDSDALTGRGGFGLYFYVDESGHTGANLFDEHQPMLYYGVLSSRINIDLLAAPKLAAIRKKLGVARLHAAELGNGRLPSMVDDIVQLQKRFDIRFDLYRVAKPDHAIICFFDQVFDQGMNPAITWTGYWTPMRYVLLLKLASLFDEDLAKLAWQARITPDDDKAHAQMQSVCRELQGRLDHLPDARSRQLIGDTLMWAEKNAKEICYNVASKKDILQVTPNIVGFQSVMHGIAQRIGKADRQASRILIDRQTEFNKAQKTLAEMYQSASGFTSPLGPGMPMLDLTNMPTVPIEFSSSHESPGLELVDIYLWVFKRVIEQSELAPELYSLVRPQMHRGRTDELSLNALGKRWGEWFEKLPQLEEMPAEQVKKGQELLKIDEERRLKAVRGLYGADGNK